MRRVKISYSIFNRLTDFSQMANEIKKVEGTGVDYLHLDVMDGHFVPSIFLGHDIVRSLRKITKTPFDVHFMVNNSDNQIKKMRTCKP